VELKPGLGVQWPANLFLLRLISFVPPTKEEDMNSATAASLRMIIAAHFRVKPARIVHDTRFVISALIGSIVSNC
jgi:hypothetical protein